MSAKKKNRKISAEFVSRVSIHGGMFYVTVPKRVVEFHDVHVGDRVLVVIQEVQRVG